jgi:hypothetical protein
MFSLNLLLIGVLVSKNIWNNYWNIVISKIENLLNDIHFDKSQRTHTMG